MIEKGTFGYEVMCEGKDCSESLSIDVESFPELLEAMKEEGWKNRRINGTWMHFCPNCG
jgi:hypothetical protein